MKGVGMNGANGLFNSTTLDVIVGLVFVYLLLAIMCTTINEWLDGMLKTRSSNLASAIKQLLDNQPDAKGNKDWFLQQFYAHPLITGMLAPGKSGGKAYPSYLPARTFATAVMDIAMAGKSESVAFSDLESGIKELPAGDGRTQETTVVIAVVLTVAINADTISIVRTLWKNPTQRAVLVEQAQKRSGEEAEETVSVKCENKDKPLQPTSIR